MTSVPLFPRQIGLVHFQQPVVHLADETLPSTYGHGIIGVRFEFRLEPRRRRTRFVAAFLRIRFDAPGAAADDLWIGQDAGTRPQASVMMLGDGALGWQVGDPQHNRLAVPTTNVAYALLEIPVGLESLSGTARLDVTTMTAGLSANRRDHGRAGSASQFDVPLPPDWSAPVRPARTRSATVSPLDTGSARPAVRLCVAADIERFSRFHAAEATRAQRRLLDVLETARRHAGVHTTDVILQKSGDGQFAILPTGIDESVVVPRLVEGLRTALRDTNEDLNDRARLRLRVAFHRGHVTPGVNGWVGGASIAVHRLLDSDVLRQALAGAPAADLALIVPEVLYREIVQPRYGTLDPDLFTEVDAAVPAKNFTERAWIHVPH